MNSSLRQWRRAAVLLLLLGPLPVAGEGLQLSSGKRQNTLIELFTSQGCSSCPPAEQWLSSLQEEPRLWHSLIPVAFHVDYWDYLGWRDSFAAPAYSQRQRRYRSEGAISTVYTPGFLVNGMEWRRWFGLGRLPRSDKETGELKVELNGKTITAEFHPLSAHDGPLQLNVAVLGLGLETVVRRGENAGRVLTQDFVVLAHAQLNSDSGSWQSRLPTVKKSSGARHAIVAWVSPAGRLAPLQAVGGWLPPAAGVSPQVTAK
jgi:hypothetical protein